jgi:hypothetical protein
MQTKDSQAAKRKVLGPIMALFRTAGPFSCRPYPPKRKMASFRLGTTRPGLCREQAGSERESDGRTFSFYRRCIGPTGSASLKTILIVWPISGRPFSL